MVALTRESGHNEELRQLIGPRAEVFELPLTATDFSPTAEVDAELRALRDFGHFRSLVVTSARCEGYLALAKDALLDVHEVFSVGPATTAMLERTQWAPSHESSGTALELADAITRGPVLILAATGGRTELCEALTHKSLQPQRVECYATRDVALDSAERERLARADVVFIGAPSAWRVARHLVSPRAWVLVPGTTTLDAVARDHPRVVVGWGEDFAHAWNVVESSAR